MMFRLRALYKLYFCTTCVRLHAVPPVSEVAEGVEERAEHIATLEGCEAEVRHILVFPFSFVVERMNAVATSTAIYM